MCTYTITTWYTDAHKNNAITWDNVFCKENETVETWTHNLTCSNCDARPLSYWGSSAGWVQHTYELPKHGTSLHCLCVCVLYWNLQFSFGYVGDKKVPIPQENGLYPVRNTCTHTHIYVYMNEPKCLHMYIRNGGREGGREREEGGREEREREGVEVWWVINPYLRWVYYTIHVVLAGDYG